MTIREIFRKSLWIQLLLVSVIGILVNIDFTYAEDAEDWMPDANLRAAIIEEIGLPEGVPLTKEHLKWLTRLIAWDSEISDLSGMEHATNLIELGICGNQISDLSPLADLVHLEYLSLCVNQISDITPLANLIQLEYLSLTNNYISNFSPLVNLTRLEKLYISGNLEDDINSLLDLNLIEFEYDEICELPRLSIAERIEARTFPSVFAAWGGIGWSPVLNHPELSDLEHMTAHDLFFSGWMFANRFVDVPGDPKVVGDMAGYRQKRNDFIALNPNMLFIAEVRVRSEHLYEGRTDEWPYWLRDTEGNPIHAFGGWAFLVDFTLPGMQDLIVNQAIAIAKCGLYDGIFFDWWHENVDIFAQPTSPTAEAQQQARDNILRRIRKSVGEDFLILVNTNRNKIPRSAPYVNGTFMETLRDYAGGYTYAGLMQIESTLSWAESNLRSPQINCLEGWGVPSEPPDSPLNKRWMRVFTTLSLTHSNGYLLYSSGGHGHYLYDFWDADLGQPVGKKAQRYENREGLFIREFTNGWAVYNRSGKTQEISLPMRASSVASGITNIQHTVPDLDGEIYLKQATGIPADVNGDGVVNILDLVVIANAFGKAAPDLNGDGVINIQDLVIVANAF